ncbi:MAG: hypothetical protein WAK27_01765 [Candidatus Sulfotelmatobacter sp.]
MADDVAATENESPASAPSVIVGSFSHHSQSVLAFVMGFRHG